MLTLLYIGVCAKSESMPKYFSRHFEFADLKPDQCINARIPFNPDIIFYQLQADRHGNNRSVDIATHFHQRFPDAFKINWSGDKRNGTEKWYYDFANYCNVSTFSNEEDVNNLRQAGYKAQFLQIGIDKEIFTPYGEAEKSEPIVFLANNHGHFPLSSYRAKAAKYLKQHYGWRFGVYGHNWKFGSGNLNGDERMQRREAALYRNADIAISVSNFDSERYTSDRLLRAMASGVMVLSHNYKGIGRDFEVGKHLDIFDNLNDLKNKIDYYLEYGNERNDIALKGCDHVHSNFSLDNMANNIKKLAGYESN